MTPCLEGRVWRGLSSQFVWPRAEEWKRQRFRLQHLIISSSKLDWTWLRLSWRADLRSPNGGITHAAFFFRRKRHYSAVWTDFYPMTHTKLNRNVKWRRQSAFYVRRGLRAAPRLTFAWWSMRGHSSDMLFCLGNGWQRGSTLLSARIHDSPELLKGHDPFSDHWTSSWDTLCSLGLMNYTS